ncbi:MAG TPA: response regulator transcription factor [Mycobacteriales bacterium]|nr:DNA-binding response regulator [Mycobacterium sp.]
MKERRRVLIVDDHPIMLRGLRTMLEGEPWVEAVFEARTVADAVKEAVTRRTQVIAMDIELRDSEGDGIEATRRIVRALPEVKILMVTMKDDDGLVSRAIEAGARGYVLKDVDPETLIDALRTVAGGGVVLGPKVGLAALTVAQRPAGALPPPLDRLTPRELEILTLLAAAETNARIARQLGLREKTVRNQLTSVFTKLGVADRTEAALLAHKLGLAG